MSSLGMGEVVSLIAEWKRISGKKSVSIDKSKYTEAQLKVLEQHQKSFSRKTKVLDLFEFQKDWKEFDSFPNFGFFVTAFTQFEKHGHYPHEGSLDSQPNRTIEILNLLTSLRREEEEQEMKKNNVAKQVHNRRNGS